MTRLTRRQLGILVALADGPRIYSSGRPHFTDMRDPEAVVRLGLAERIAGGPFKITNAGRAHIRRACELPTGGDR